MKELTENPNIIVFIDELHTLVGAGSAEGSLDAANILKPALSRGEIRCIGATTPAEYRKYIEKDRSLERRFQAIKVDPPSREGDDRGPDRREGSLRDVPSRRVHARGDRGGGLSVEPLHHRSVPARQGDRPDRRGGRARQAARGGLQRGVRRDQQAASASPSSRWRTRSRRRTSRRRSSTASRKCRRARTCSSCARSSTSSRARAGSSSARQEIDEVVSKWTGVPLTSINQDEGDKLLRMEEELHKPRHQPGEGDLGAVARDPPLARRAEEPEPSGRQLHVPRPDRRRQDRAGARAGQLPVRQRPRAHPLRHVRVHGEALGVEADRLAAGIRRPRRGRAAHREGEAQPLLGRAARRNREGAPGPLQHPAAGVRGRPPHRRPRQPGELQEHDHHHDVEHRRPLHPEEGVARVPVDRLAAPSAAASTTWCSARSSRPSTPSSSTASTRSSCSRRCRTTTCGRSRGCWSSS